MKSKASLITLLSIAFLDMVGIGIVIPILPIIFLDLTNQMYLLGFLLASYPLAQFFGAPLLGTLSDKYGRKKILLISLAGSTIGYVLFAIGLLIHNIPLLFISRILDGFTGGNLSVVQSAIADVSKKNEKVKNFGLIGMAFGLGFIIGPFLGGILTDNTLVSWFNTTTPFWTAAVLVLINMLFVMFFFKETLKERLTIKINLFSGFQQIKKAFSLQHLRILFLSIFLFHFGWSFFTHFFPVFLSERLSYTPADVGKFFAFIGVCVAIVQGIILRKVSEWIKPRKLIMCSLFLLVPILLYHAGIKSSLMLYAITPFLALNIGFIHPNFSTLISNEASPQEQGEVLGIQQSMMSLAQAIPALIAGFAISISITAPIILSSITLAITWAVFTFGWKKNN